MKFRIVLPILFILSLMITPLLAKEGTLIVLYGTQCAGKSTLSKQLIQTLPGNIEVVKRTPIVVEYRKDFIEQVTGVRPKTRNEVKEMGKNLPRKYRKMGIGKFKRKALPPTIEIIREKISRGKTVIFDVCLYRSNELNLLKDLNTVYVLVYSPIHDLSIRQQERTIRTKRNKIHQQHCRKYILNGFSKLYEPTSKSKAFDYVRRKDIVDFFHDVEYQDLDDVDSDYLNIFCRTVQRLQLDQNRQVPIAPKKKPDILINTGRLTPEEGAKIVKNYIRYRRKG